MFDSRFTKTNQESSPLAFFKPILGLLISYILLYFLCRCLFLGWNWAQFSKVSANQLILVFLHGLRFDLVILAPLVFLLCLAAVFRPTWLRWVLFSGVTAFAMSLFFINFVDIELVNFTGRRFTHASLYLAQEGQTGNLAQYKFLTVMTFVGLADLVLVSFFWFRRIHTTLQISNWRLKASGFLVLLLVAVLCGRGGLQFKPVSYVDAKVINHPFVHHLVLNSGFTFIKSLSQKSFQREKYFSNEKMLGYLNLNPTLIKSTVAVKPEKLNLVIFIIESLSQEYLATGKMPFFMSLAQQGVYFDRAYANGRRSIEGIASILTGIPALMEEPFLNSEFATNDFMGLGHLLKNHQYETSFFHGAQNGSMRFDVFTKASGFDQYFGKNEYANSKDDDGSWGIYDQPFLQFQCEKLSQMKPPFGSVVFTLSTHQPFTVPEDFEKNYSPASDNEAPILKSFNYFDQALKTYFECARKQPWFERTLFVFVSDHTGPALDESQSGFKNKFEIPLLLYSVQEDLLKGIDPHQYAQQIDLLPTLNDLLGLGFKQQNHLARSLLQAGQKTIALYSDQHYELVGDTALTEDHLKAVRQYFSEGLYDNRLYFPQTSGN